MEQFFWIGIVGAVIALLFAYTQARKVKQYSEGTPTMQKIAAAIRKGANAYLKRQYKTVGPTPPARASTAAFASPSPPAPSWASPS